MSFATDLAGLDLDAHLEREWLVTNGLGGYASSTVCGLNTRKYHGLLVAAMTPPVQRMVVLSRVEETLYVGGQLHALSCAEYPGAVNPRGYALLRKFANDPHPRWAWQGDGWTLGKWLRLLPGRNAVCLSYFLLGSDHHAELAIRPMLALRGIHDLSYQWNGKLGTSRVSPRLWRVNATCRTPEVFLSADGEFDATPLWYLSHIYRREAERGYPALEDLWTPGAINWSLRPGQAVHVVCSTDALRVEDVIGELDRSEPLRDLGLATPPAERPIEALRRAVSMFVPSRATRSELSAVPVTSYPWSPPSVRDALVGYRGLFLLTDRADAGERLLRWCVAELRDGLVPSELRDSDGASVHGGADVSLWFVNAAHEHLQHDWNERLARDLLLPAVLRILECYEHGTRLGICCDAAGLLHTHEPGQPTTWMNARVGDWVVTPRQGCPVELQALWHNALRIAASLCERLHADARAASLEALADRVQASFNERFWHEADGTLYDVLDEHGRDPSVRPNALLAIALPFPVLDRPRWQSLLATVRQRLLVPGGLRTLAGDDPCYRGHYRGDVLARDRALHQGSACPHLLAWYARSLIRASADRESSRSIAIELLEPILERLDGEGFGTLAELRDGDSPHAWGGAIASALPAAAWLDVLTRDVLSVREPELPFRVELVDVPPPGREKART